jgi:hypothetical protein
LGEASERAAEPSDDLGACRSKAHAGDLTADVKVFRSERRLRRRNFLLGGEASEGAVEAPSDY